MGQHQAYEETEHECLQTVFHAAFDRLKLVRVHVPAVNRRRRPIPSNYHLWVRRRELISLQVRHYVDPQTELPRIYRYDVSELEVEQVLERPAEERPGDQGLHVAIGPTSTERILRVIYAPGPQPSSMLVLTAYDLRGKLLLAHRRRYRRKSQ